MEKPLIRSINGKNITVVMEDKTTLDSISSYLSSKEAKVFSYDNYDMALDFLEKNTIDYLVCDYHRTNISVYNFLERLYYHFKSFPPILLLTTPYKTPFAHPEHQLSSYTNKGYSQQLSKALNDRFQQQGGFLMVANPLTFSFVEQITLLSSKNDDLFPIKTHLLDLHTHALLLSAPFSLKLPRKNATLIVEYLSADQNRQRPLHGEIIELQQGLFQDQIFIFTLVEEDWGIWKDLNLICQKQTPVIY